MHTTRKPPRGVQDIRTHAGKVDRASVPYMAYMRISVLEMAKARLHAEKQSALRRIENITARIKEVEAEKDALLRTLGERNGRTLTGDTPSAAPPELRQDGEGFKLRY